MNYITHTLQVKRTISHTTKKNQTSLPADHALPKSEPSIQAHVQVNNTFFSLQSQSATAEKRQSVCTLRNYKTQDQPADFVFC